VKESKRKIRERRRERIKYEKSERKIGEREIER
jgi:hypothetical protein